MKEILSNSWVISIISGILVFFVTNFFVIVRGKKESKRQIYDANTMVLNHLRGYVVDNGLPSEKIIEAVKNSIMREYNIKYSDLLSTKELCEELVKDIIGNIYISNDNKKTYISMLEKYLEQTENIKDEDADADEKSIDKEHNGRAYEYISTVISIIAGLMTTIGVSFTTFIDDISEVVDSINTNNLIISIISVVFIIVILTIFYFMSKRKNNYPMKQFF